MGCSSGAPLARQPVMAASPPKDDGQASKGGRGGEEHAAALEQLKVQPIAPRVDKQGAVRVWLPDAERWTRVRFWGVPSLAGFRYGKEHHALVGVFVTHAEKEGGSAACAKQFEQWALPWVEAFDVDVHHASPAAFGWNGDIVEVDVLSAETATLADSDEYAGTYAAFPAWEGACLIVGVAVPARGDMDRAVQVRDRFAHEILRRFEVLSSKEPADLY